MNYILEIKAFYDRLETSPLPGSSISLWYALMSIANKAGWPDTFAVASTILAFRAGLSDSALKRARNILIESGMIEWEPGNGSRAARYRMISLVTPRQFKTEPQSAMQSEPQNEPQNEPQSEPQNEPQSEPQNEPQSEPQSEPQNGPINKHKHKLSLSVSACAREEPTDRFPEFWNAYPKKVNMLNASGEYVYVLETTKELTEDSLIAAARNYAETCRILRTKERFTKNPENWLKESVWIQYLPENYKKPRDDDAGREKCAPKNKFNNFEQRQYDYDHLEQMLLTTNPCGSRGEAPDDG